MKKTSSAVLLLCVLAGCANYQSGAMSQQEQQRIMQEVAASRVASATAFVAYVEVCLKHFPSATNARDDEGQRLSVQGTVNVALNDGGHELVCSVNVTTRAIERIWADQRTYTLDEYKISEHGRKTRSALASKDAELIASGKSDAFVRDAKRAITDNFKDPDSALFRDVFLSNKAVPTLCGEVNAKNSYGGYVGYKRFFFNRIASYVEPAEPSRASPAYVSFLAVYCSDKFADVPR
jgi:hypothetical protein